MNGKDADLWLHGLTRVAMADGTLRAGERRLLERAAGGIGIGRRKLGRELASARAELYRESRAARRWRAPDG